MSQDQEFTRGMVVVAHADDAEYGCSGTVAKLCAEGWEMVYVLCTDGSKGSSDREITQEELVRIREGEQIEAGKVLGLKDVVFLRNEDSMLQPTLELRKDIAREIRRYRPDVVITTHPVRSLDGGWGIGHPDHMAAGEAALAAVFPTARDHMTYPDLLEDGLEPHKVAEVWIMGHPEPDTWVDVTEHIDTSIKALLSHDSQVNGHSPEETANMMREWRRKRAEGKGMQYAEAFKRIPMRR
ncbi:MAG: PIG-L family deacetylase [SAR202 cluster bacterium]|jgi:LmbE family N-acetylglucosaminyl deacetylase|nr:PIG-L family deacetylase [SAR202 cluster bacterium]